MIMMILCIAAGVLLALAILPYLGTIGMIVLSIAALAFFGFMALMAMGFISTLPDLAKDTKADIDKKIAESFGGRVKASKEYQQGDAKLEELLTLTKQQHGARSMQYKMVLQQRFSNCSKIGSFRVEDVANRAELVKYLGKVAQINDAQIKAKAELLSKEVLTAYDAVCKAYPAPKVETQDGVIVLRSEKEIKAAEQKARDRKVLGIAFIGVGVVGLLGINGMAASCAQGGYLDSMVDALLIVAVVMLAILALGAYFMNTYTKLQQSLDLAKGKEILKEKE